jgi:hypothetical protein
MKNASTYNLIIYYPISMNKKIKDMVFQALQNSHKMFLFHPVSNFNTLRHQFESGKTQKTAGRRLSVAIGNTKVTIGITIIQV